MKIINNSDNEYKIYDDHVNVYEQLPAQTYRICFDNMKGFVLRKRADIEVNEKVYGIHVSRANKVLKTFKSLPRSLGVILSGDRGIGKSLCARMICLAAIEKGYPVIVVDEYIEGINLFIEEIEQEVVLVFDEFDKTFRRQRVVEEMPVSVRSIPFPTNVPARQSEEKNPQLSMLSLFDGMSSGKRLFVITCNEVRALNEYFINRPGRFHYHFRFDYLSADEIKEYMQDKLDKQYWPEIPKVIRFAAKVNINYDSLRAIVWEIGQGEPFEEAIKDLNILNTEGHQYSAILYFSDSSTMFVKKAHLDLFQLDSEEQLWLTDAKGKYTGVGISFPVNRVEYEPDRDCHTVPGSVMNVMYDDGDMDPNDMARIKALTPAFMTITRSKGKAYHYDVK